MQLFLFFVITPSGIDGFIDYDEIFDSIVDDSPNDRGDLEDQSSDLEVHDTIEQLDEAQKFPTPRIELEKSSVILKETQPGGHTRKEEIAQDPRADEQVMPAITVLNNSAFSNRDYELAAKIPLTKALPTHTLKADVREEVQSTRLPSSDWRVIIN